MGYWKNKLLGVFKKERYKSAKALELPQLKFTSKLECDVEINGKMYYFSVPIPISKNKREQAKELLYCQVYETVVIENH
jgi:hypothetical protein